MAFFPFLTRFFIPRESSAAQLLNVEIATAVQ